jgi:Fe2+ transport system protein FeoA
VTLTEAKEGDILVVTGTRGDDVTLQALRFGINEGSVIEVHKKIPGGPVIVSKNQLEIAIGPQIAVNIEVVRKSELQGERK